MINIINYNSLVEFSKDLQSPVKKICQDYVTSDMRGESRERWTGTASFAEADNLLLNGDMVNAQKLVDAVTNCIYNGKRRAGLQPAVVGCVPCVPNAVRNLPLSMLQTSKRPSRPIIRLMINISTPHNTSANTITENAAKVLSAIKAVEAAGYSIELSVCCYTLHTPEYIFSRITAADAFTILVKKAGEHLDIARLAYILCNPSFLRRHSFRWFETHYTGRSKKVARCKGYSIAPPDAIDATTDNGTVEDIINKIKAKAK